MDLGTAGSSEPSRRPSKLSGPSRSWEAGFRMREIPTAEWEARRGLLTHLYFTEGRHLDEVRKIMAIEHDFYAKYVASRTMSLFDLWANSNGFCAQRYAM